MSENEWLESRKCALCGKEISVLYPQLWRYKRWRNKAQYYLCSWSCLRAFDERKDIMDKRKYLSPKEKLEAVRLALEGGNPLKYIDELGISNPSCSWYYIKKKLKEDDPETYDRLPAKYKGMSKAEPTGKLSDKETGNMTVIATREPPQIPAVKIDGAIRIETPEAKKVEVVETPETPGKITAPVAYDGMVIREVEGKFGRYRRSDVSGQIYIDFEGTDRLETLSMTVEQWRGFGKEFVKCARILGVEM